MTLNICCNGLRQVNLVPCSRNVTVKQHMHSSYQQQAQTVILPSGEAGCCQRDVAIRQLPAAADVFPVNAVEYISVARVNVTQTHSSSSQKLPASAATKAVKREKREHIVSV